MVQSLSAVAVHQQPIRCTGKNVAYERATISLAARSISRSTHQVAPLLHQAQHGLDREHRPNLVSGVYEHVLASGDIDAGGDRIENAPAAGIQHPFKNRIFRRKGLHDGYRSVIRIVVDDDDLAGYLDHDA